MVNFFYLDRDPKKCAQYYCNKHIIKIPIEIAQILSKVHYQPKYASDSIDHSKIYKNSLVVKDGLGPYVWVTESLDNYIKRNNINYRYIKYLNNRNGSFIFPKCIPDIYGFF